MGDEDVFNEATRMIVKGDTPLGVAALFPILFAVNHEGIIRFWETLNRRSWRINE